MSNPQALAIVRQNYAYFVRKDGQVVYGPACHERAIEALERLQRKAQEKVRPCIICQTEFTSTGPGNRMCPRCRGMSLHDGRV